MAKLNVKVNIPTIKRLREISKSSNQDLIGKYVISDMKDFISKGISPVKGEGKFEAYSGVRDRATAKKNISRLKKIVANNPSKKAQRSLSAYKGVNTRANKKYPFNVQKEYPNKKASPVNLMLSGEMLKALTFQKFSSFIRIGIFDKQMKDRAKVHNAGDEKKFIPKRHFIPDSTGDDFVVSIRIRLKELYSQILSGIINKSK